MNSIIVNSSEGITILGAGEALPDALEHALQYAPFLVAADGGAKHALRLKHTPKAVIGDLDSIDPKTLLELPEDIVHRISEQDTTDFDKCLRSVSAPIILATGFTGGRIDHELAAFSVLVKFSDKPIVMIGAEDVVFVAPSDFNLSLPVGTRVSLFPMGDVRGESQGLRWPIGGIDFAPGKRIGTSNEALSTDIHMQFSARNMLVLLPRDYLKEAISVVAPSFHKQTANK